MPHCYVSTCSNYWKKTRNLAKKITYHILPASSQMVAKWNKVCRKNDSNFPPHARICSEHFSENCYKRDLQHELLGLPLRKQLKPEAVPNMKLPAKSDKSKKEVLKTVVSDNQMKTTKGMIKHKNKPRIQQIHMNHNGIKNKETQNKNKGEVNGLKKQQNITVIDITTDDTALNRKHMLKNFRINTSTPIKQTRLNKSDEQKLNILDINKLNLEIKPSVKNENLNLYKYFSTNNTINVSKNKLKLTETNVIKRQANNDIHNNNSSRPEREVEVEYKLELPKIKEENLVPLQTNLVNDFNETTGHHTPDIISLQANKELSNKIVEPNDRFKKMPMRSSIRIAKKKSIESLSDSFTEKVNNKRDCNKRERFSDKLKFMAKLQLKHEKNEKNSHQVIDLDQFFKEIITKQSMPSLNKMQILENVVEGCNVQPSSPGHAEERNEEIKVKSETKVDDLDRESTNDNEEHKTKEENPSDITKSENISNGVKDEPDSSEIQDEVYSNSSSPKTDNKRKSESQEYPVKRLKTEIQENFISRDKIINDFIEMADCTNLDQINSFSEQLLVEIKTLNEFAKEKEREWNNVIHLKKLKEELLLRMQRKKQILIINEKSDSLDFLSESQNGNAEEGLKTSSPQSILKSNLINPIKMYTNPSNINGNLYRQKQIIPKTQNNIDLNGQGKRLTLDVQSIIADYRQRHPESVPRRGRRIRCLQSDNPNKIPNSIINFSSMALGSGAQVRQGDVSNDLGLLLSTINMNREDSNKVQNVNSSCPNSQDSVSFKDMLLQFAKLSQNERNELIQNVIKPPPPYPEVTVHPVATSTQQTTQTNSLLHGILTKSPTKQNSKTTFSPTLARLLTAPERNANNQSLILNNAVHPSNMSISEILSTSKACNEITITPVDTQYESTPNKEKSMDEETEDSADRLVIDENNDIEGKKTNSDNNSDVGDDIPVCQGCNQKPAQFVCAGCGNQWYCSRDCQVNAWDEHSEVCSG